MSEPCEFVQLLRAARNGCREAGEELVHAYGQHIMRVARKCSQRYSPTGDVEADDLAQSAWCILLTEPGGVAQLDTPQMLRYVKQIIARKAIDASRRTVTRSRNSRRVETQQASRITHRQQSDDPAVIVESIDLLAAANCWLTAEERTICAWRRAGYTWQQIADVMNRTRESVQKRFDRAVVRIRRKALGA